MSDLKNKVDRLMESSVMPLLEEWLDKLVEVAEMDGYAEEGATHKAIVHVALSKVSKDFFPLSDEGQVITEKLKGIM